MAKVDGSGVEREHAGVLILNASICIAASCQSGKMKQSKIWRTCFFFRVRGHPRREQPLVKGQEVKDTDSYISVQG